MTAMGGWLSVRFTGLERNKPTFASSAFGSLGVELLWGVWHGKADMGANINSGLADSRWSAAWKSDLQRIRQTTSIWSQRIALKVELNPIQHVVHIAQH